MKIHSKGVSKSSSGGFSLHMCIFLKIFFLVVGIIHMYMFCGQNEHLNAFLFLTPLTCSNVRGSDVIFKSLHRSKKM